MDLFSLWLETTAQPHWEDYDGNPIPEPNPGEDCTATLPDGSKVVFDFSYDYVKVTYSRKAPKNEVETAIKLFADTNPDDTLDGYDLNRFLDNYKEIKTGLYQRFEPEPGDDVGGETYEPDEEPDLGEYMMRKSRALYPHGPQNYITQATGYVLADGRTVTMGRGNRDDDHRYMIPSLNSMKKWNWPETDSDTQNMYELVRRSGAIRINVSDPFYITAAKPLTRKQRQTVREYLSDNKIKDVIISFIGGREYEFETDDHRQMDRYL